MTLTKILLSIGAFLLILVAAILGLASTKPDTMHIERTVTIAATPATITPLLNDFHEWDKWSPYKKLDPDMTQQYSGAAKGVGSVYEWKGNADVGAGRMEMLESDQKHLLIDLVFTAPMQAHDTAEFILVPRGDGTDVTWSTTGPMNLLSKVMCLFMDIDAMVGGQFETGLAQLKTLAERK